MSWPEAFSNVGIAMAVRWLCIRFAAGGGISAPSSTGCRSL